MRVDIVLKTIGHLPDALHYLFRFIKTDKDDICKFIIRLQLN